MPSTRETILNRPGRTCCARVRMFRARGGRYCLKRIPSSGLMTCADGKPGSPALDAVTLMYHYPAPAAELGGDRWQTARRDRDVRF